MWLCGSLATGETLFPSNAVISTLFVVLYVNGLDLMAGKKSHILNLW